MNKQIEEMAWDLCDIPKHPSIKSCEQCGNKHCLAMYYAKRACNNGYRKASDVAREIFSEIDEARERWESVYGKDHFGYGGDAYGYLQIDVDHTIYELKKKYESEGADDV